MDTRPEQEATIGTAAERRRKEEERGGVRGLEHRVTGGREGGSEVNRSSLRQMFHVLEACDVWRDVRMWRSVERLEHTPKAPPPLVTRYAAARSSLATPAAVATAKPAKTRGIGTWAA